MKKMKEFEYIITDSAGLHARPAGLLVKKAKEYKSRITIFANGRGCEVKSLISLMGMCIKCGTPVRVTVEGDDEQICAEEIELYFKQNL